MEFGPQVFTVNAQGQIVLIDGVKCNASAQPPQDDGSEDFITPESHVRRPKRKPALCCAADVAHHHNKLLPGGSQSELLARCFLTC